MYQDHQDHIEKDITVRNLRKSYNGKKVLDISSLDIPMQRIIGVVGRSGAGKSTLFNVLATTIYADDGQITLQNKNHETFVITKNIIQTRPSLKKISRTQFQKKLGLTFILQTPFFLQNFSLEYNVMLPMLLQNPNQSDEEMKKFLDELLTNFGLGNYRQHTSEQLSGGQRIRAGIVRALSTKPTLILADEPTNNLDIMNEKIVLKAMFDAVRSCQGTLLLATHSPSILMQTDVIIGLSEGTIAFKKETKSLNIEKLNDFIEKGVCSSATPP